MNKYRDKSDFEINKAVSVEMFGLNRVIEKGDSIYIDECDYGAMVSFDPCNDPYDAMPIIIENKITVAHDHHDCVWCAYIGSEISTHSDNYYRSAMICFLMMKDAE